MPGLQPSQLSVGRSGAGIIIKVIFLQNVAIGFIYQSLYIIRVIVAFRWIRECQNDSISSIFSQTSMQRLA